MHYLLSVILVAATAEIIRRCCMAFITAFTGPMSKIPGPLISKLTAAPWQYQCLRGNMMNITPAYFEKYGDIVRIGRSLVPTVKQR
jgi:hypothetical protein